MATRLKPRFIAGGPEDDPSDGGRARRVYPCLAHGCPMPGAIFLNGPEAPGICAWHYGASSSEMPQITQVLRNWECVSSEINAYRALSNDPTRAMDVKAIAEAKTAAWGRMIFAIDGSGWVDELRPPPSESYADWTARLVEFMAWRINADVRGRHERPKRSPTVLDMLTRVKPGRGNVADYL